MRHEWSTKACSIVELVGALEHIEETGWEVFTVDISDAGAFILCRKPAVAKSTLDKSAVSQHMQPLLGYTSWNQAFSGSRTTPEAMVKWAVKWEAKHQATINWDKLSETVKNWQEGNKRKYKAPTNAFGKWLEKGYAEYILSQHGRPPQRSTRTGRRSTATTGNGTYGYAPDARRDEAVPGAGVQRDGDVEGPQPELF